MWVIGWKCGVWSLWKCGGVCIIHLQIKVVYGNAVFGAHGNVVLGVGGGLSINKCDWQGEKTIFNLLLGRSEKWVDTKLKILQKRILIEI